MSDRFVSKATLGRLPQYLHYLKALSKTADTTSATAIAKGLGLGEVQVRKDLAAASGTGRPKVGYVVEELILQLERCLGCGHVTEAVLVGAGKLGLAILDYDGFEAFGVKIVAAFDEDHTAQNGDVRPMAQLPEFCSSRGIKLGIITVGQQFAQKVCDSMVDCGIEAIWSFAPCGLKVPEGVLLKQENFALSLAYLNNLLGNRD